MLGAGWVPSETNRAGGSIDFSSLPQVLVILLVSWFPLSGGRAVVSNARQEFCRESLQHHRLLLGAWQEAGESGQTTAQGRGLLAEVGLCLFPLRFSPWLRLPYSHWPMLFGLYNISVYGHRLVLLPPILLSTVVSPEVIIFLVILLCLFYFILCLHQFSYCSSSIIVSHSPGCGQAAKSTRERLRG